MQRVRKRKHAAPSRTIGRRLREISDLNAACDVLNWDQATHMPEGAGAHGRQRAMLNPTRQ